MKVTDIIESAKEFVKEMMKNNDPSHDWYHVERVYKNALHIIEQENILNNNQLKYDLEIIKLASLFHDVVDFKYDFKENKSLDEIAQERLNQFFDKFNYPQENVDKIVYIVLNISWRKELESGNNCTDLPIELKVVRDADRLDAIGAVGVARCLVFSGARDRPIYIEDQNPIINMTAEQYNQQTIQNKSTAINHFYEKLLLIKDRMQTETGKKLAQQRHDFMLSFLNQFHLEVNQTTIK